MGSRSRARQRATNLAGSVCLIRFEHSATIQLQTSLMVSIMLPAHSREATSKMTTLHRLLSRPIVPVKSCKAKHHNVDETQFPSLCHKIQPRNPYFLGYAR